MNVEVPYSAFCLIASVWIKNNCVEVYDNIVNIVISFLDYSVNEGSI